MNLQNQRRGGGGAWGFLRVPWDPTQKSGLQEEDGTISHHPWVGINGESSLLHGGTWVAEELLIKEVIKSWLLSGGCEAFDILNDLFVVLGLLFPYCAEPFQGLRFFFWVLILLFNLCVSTQENR